MEEKESNEREDRTDRESNRDSCTKWHLHCPPMDTCVRQIMVGQRIRKQRKGYHQEKMYHQLSLSSSLSLEFSTNWT